MRGTTGAFTETLNPADFGCLVGTGLFLKAKHGVKQVQEVREEISVVIDVAFQALSKGPPMLDSKSLHRTLDIHS